MCVATACLLLQNIEVFHYGAYFACHRYYSDCGSCLPDAWTLVLEIVNLFLLECNIVPVSECILIPHLTFYVLHFAQTIVWELLGLTLCFSISVPKKPVCVLLVSL